MMKIYNKCCVVIYEYKLSRNIYKGLKTIYNTKAYAYLSLMEVCVSE